MNQRLGALYVISHVSARSNHTTKRILSEKIYLLKTANVMKEGKKNQGSRKQPINRMQHIRHQNWHNYEEDREMGRPRSR
jgi:hypothetical protein